MTRLDYPFTMHPLSEDEGGGYLIEFPDLPGCMSDGPTPEEAVQNGADAVRCWIEAMHEAGRPIPAPSRAPVGLRTINVDEHIYRMLAEEAERQGLEPSRSQTRRFCPALSGFWIERMALQERANSAPRARLDQHFWRFYRPPLDRLPRAKTLALAIARLD